MTELLEDATTEVINIDDDSKYLLYLLALGGSQISHDQLFSAFKNLRLNSDINWRQGYESALELLDSMSFLDIDTGTLEADLEHQLTVAACLDPKSKQLIGVVKQIFNDRTKRTRLHYLAEDFHQARLRLALYTNDLEYFKICESEYKSALNRNSTAAYWNLSFVYNIIDELGADELHWYRSLDPYLQSILNTRALQQFLSNGLRNTLVDLICNQSIDRIAEELRISYLTAQLYFGRLSLVKEELAKYKLEQFTDEQMYLSASYNLLIDNVDQAYIDFQLGLALARPSTNNQTVIIPSPPFSLFYALTLLKQDPSKHYSTILNIVSKTSNKYSNSLEKSIKLIANLAVGDNLDAENNYRSLQEYTKPIGSIVIGHLVLALIDLSFYYYDKVAAEEILSRNKGLVEEASTSICELTKKLYRDINKAIRSSNINGCDSEIKLDFTKLIDKDLGWQRKLDTLQTLFKLKDSSSQELKIGSKRLAWQFIPSQQGLKLIEQTLMKNGRWSSGKLRDPQYEQYELLNRAEYATKQDKEVISTYGSTSLIKQSLGLGSKESALYCLVGHPNIYNTESHNQPCSFHKANVKLLVHETADHQVLIKLSHQAAHRKIFVEEIDKTNYQIVHFDKSSVELFKTLGPSGIAVPASAKEQVLSILKQANSLIEIETELDYEDLPSIEADSRPHLTIDFDHHSYHLSIHIRTQCFGDWGPLALPGEGSKRLTAIKDNVKFQSLRDLNQEEFLAKQLLGELGLEYVEGFNWVIISTELETSLDILMKLEALQQAEPERLKIIWEEGAKVKAKSISYSSLSLNVKSKNNWFEYSGEVIVDEDQVLDFAELLDLIGNSPSRYVKLNNGEFLALTQELKKSLESLRYSSSSSGSDSKVHSLAYSTLEDVVEKSASVNLDQEWSDFIAKIKNFNKLKIPTPKGLKAELRDYQKEGYKWLYRLSQIGAGACLADDMGLGKTLQTIAVMLPLIKTNPVLVVAPASVVHNWQSEIAKFAPSIKVTLLSEFGTTEARTKIIKKAGSGDLIVCSYGLLHQIAETLRSKQWSMLVLDESQAIKNPMAKRSQAAKSLLADFKLVLTGTPIENNLTELWSQFNFINPGLLGSLESFRAKFANAIEMNKDKVAQTALRQMIAPYILRRLKSDVLQDLPPKIEQTVKIDFDVGEAALYEALRQKAIENIENLDQKDASKRKFHILSEMTKLRRACCHPSLVNKQIELEGTKNQHFKELIAKLMANNHKALVFSQYTSYLSIIQEELDLMGVNYLYLDGSTPIGKRKQLVESFQNGEADVFLLSLKAGGSGLNLTAADYVIHLDPWWNPAVEDQASDRTHRIGQKKTVNVYRLIMRGSIEEKIIAMHEQKRELADELLDGADITAKLSEAELMSMIRA